MRTFEQRIERVIAGALLALAPATQGCFQQCETTEVRTVNDVGVMKGHENIERTFDERLQQLEADNPDATPNEALEYIYGTEPGAPQVFLVERARELITQAVEDGGLSREACEGICRNQFRSATVDACEAPNESEERVVVCDIRQFNDCGGVGRRPQGLRGAASSVGSPVAQYWARTAHLEEAAVHAFVELACSLKRFGAPPALVERCEQAAQEEIMHARWTGQVAIRHGVTPPVVAVAPQPPCTLWELAAHNAVEGCILETLGAVTAQWQAMHGPQAYREALARIAREERSHAALSWHIHAWALTQLSPAEARQLEALQVAALRRVRQSDDAVELPPELGLPDVAARRVLIDRLCDELHVQLAA